MRTVLQKFNRLLLLAVLVVVSALATPAEAGWGSIRCNNRWAGRRGWGHGERRRLSSDADRPLGFFWSRFQPGMTVGLLPAGYVLTSVGATGYYYCDGVFYQPTTSDSYLVVAPPVGAVVPQLPDGAEPLVLGATTYYYGAGAFYVQGQMGFELVAAPLGVTLTDLPPGAVPIMLNGVAYYVAGSTYFRPLMEEGETVYITAQP